MSLDAIMCSSGSLGALSRTGPRSYLRGLRANCLATRESLVRHGICEFRSDPLPVGNSPLGLWGFPRFRLLAALMVIPPNPTTEPLQMEYPPTAPRTR